MKNDNYKASIYADKCIQYNGGYKPAYLLKAEALKRMGKLEEAKRYVEFAEKNLK